MAAHRWLEDPRLARLGILGALAALVAFHAANNWRWLTENVTILGWDVPSHLGTSLIYNDILQPLSLRTLFTAITWHPNRPPLFFLSAVPLYRLFGVSADVGTMVNVLYLAVLLGSVYGIGHRLGGRRVGLLAAFVTATLPVIYAISRYFYLELALTAMVALSIYLLLASERFEHRALSLLFGLSFGLGLLTKRTYLVFILFPLCLIVVRSQAPQALRQRLKGGFHLDIRDGLLALGLGLALSVAWYWPARDVANQLALGVWLVPAWTLLVAATIYLLRREPGPDTNLLSALFLGGTIGSLWYLPRITFVQRLLSFGFGINDPRERSANLVELGTYFYFPIRLINEHISLVTFVLLAVVALGLFVALWRKGAIWSTLCRASDAWWVTVLWMVAAYLVFTFSIYRKSRGITPVLPAVALLLAASLFRLPWKKAIVLLVAFIVGWGLLQFFVLSYEGPHWLAERTTFELPVLGDTGVFAQGGTIQLPAAGETDRGYWVVPDILSTIEAGREAVGRETVTVGVLVNNEHVNPDLFGLAGLQRYPGVQVHNLARTGSADSVYNQLFEHDYLVMIEGDYLLIDAAAQEALDHLDAAPGFFAATFELVERFPLPDGDTVLLYRNARQPAPGYSDEDYHAAAEFITAFTQEDGAILLVPPEQIGALGRAYDGRLTPYLLPQQQPLDPEGTAQALEEITARHPILFVVFQGEEAADPGRFVEEWLNEHAYRSQSTWHGGARVVVYGAPLEGEGGALDPGEGVEHPLEVRFGEGVGLLGYSLAGETAEPGRMVRVALLWQADQVLDERFTVFAHLLDGEGQVVAQQDSEPAGGSRPTTTWAPGEAIADRVGILIPPDAPGGEYLLVAGMYNAGTGERLPVLDETGGIAGDSVPLTTILVSEP